MSTKREWTRDEIVQAVKDFKEALVYVQSNYSYWNNVVQDCDKAFGDIRHYCELQYPTRRKNRTKVCQLLRDYSIERRKYKDLVQVTKPIFEISENMDNKSKNFLFTQIKEACKLNEQTQPGTRYYRPRIVTELFEENETDTEEEI